jgi:hypothetical protein|tara:strand:+ start:306 stop:875 length:570 start_codon:yes stop_codon:yes gene_type:complete
MTDFIGVYDVDSADIFCKKVFDHLKNIQMMERDKSKKSITGSEYFYLQEEDSTLLNFNIKLLNEFHNIIKVVLEDYTDRYKTVFESGPGPKIKLNPNIKLQKTSPSEGYHVWHCENSGLINSSRVFFFIMYLNDIEEGGETEFLYQNKRVQPKEGRIIMAPASWTHAHRGNTTLKGDKYILTGWFEYAE